MTLAISGTNVSQQRHAHHSDFVEWGGACQLTDAGRRVFFEVYERRKATVVTHPLFGYKMSYGRMLAVQARLLAAYIRGDVPAYQGFTVR